MSQEQPQQSIEGEGSDKDAIPTSGKKQRAKKVLVKEEDVMPRPSYWPIVTAFVVALFLLGAVGNPIIMSISGVLLLLTLIGWGLERR